MTDKPSFLSRAGHPDIAYLRQTGTGPGVLWLGGYASDMRGTKAAFLADWAARHGRSFCRFDYTGHGDSGGDFEDGSIGEWAQDALAVLDQLTDGPQILVGSSMGAWVACLLAKWRPEKTGAMLLIAPAPDFTSELMWPSWDEVTRQTMMRAGRVEIPSAYDDSVMVYTRKLVEDGEANRVLSQPLDIDVPVRILQGMEDETVPWQHAVRLAEHIGTGNVILTLIKKGDHRLSTPDDLELLAETLEAL